MSFVPTQQYDRSIAFCASARTGLGHLRRITNIAAQIKARQHGIGLMLVCNAPIAGLSHAEASLFSRIVRAERGAMARQLSMLGADAVAVDTAVIPELELLPVPLALILRETVEERVAAFRLPAGRAWSLVLVAEPAGGWTVSRETVGADEVRHVGWVYRTAARDAPLLGRSSGERILLIATGGGGSDSGGSLQAEIGRIVEDVRACAGVPLRILQIAGPRLGAAALIAGADAILEVGSRLDQAFLEADAVISTAGYNSILELAATDTPALLCTVSRTYDDQKARAGRWGPALGMAHDVGQHAEAAHWLADVLRFRRRRPTACPAPSGCGTAAEALLGLAGRPTQAFVKPYRAAAPGIGGAVALRSRQLFAAGIPTPPAAVGSGSDQVVFARLEGDTAFDVWAAHVSSGADASCMLPLIGRVMAPLACLHRVETPPTDLPAHTITSRITPRLAPGSLARDRLAPRHRLAIERHVARINRMLETTPSAKRACGLIHGDFHLRQLIQPKDRGDFIIVDLDDLAIGRPEADIGNCIAHILTSPRLHDGDLLSGLQALLPLFCRGYECEGGVLLDRGAVRLYAAAGFLRRALKRIETTGDLTLIDAVIIASEVLMKCDGVQSLGGGTTWPIHDNPASQRHA